MLIGLTGKYCAGKNHIAKLLEARGLEVLDVDKLGHQATEEQKETIVALFGPSILRADGSIDRKILGDRVFPYPDKLAALEKIIHPAANRLCDEWIAARPGKNLVLNAALIHRANAFSRLDCVIVVTASPIVRFFRALRRDRLSPMDILKRFRSQKTFGTQYWRNKTDIYIVRNKGSFGPCAETSARALGRRIDSILTRIGMVR